MSDENGAKQTVPKSAQDALGRLLSAWRNRAVAREMTQPYLDIACGDNRLAGEHAQVPGAAFGVDVLDHGGADLLVRDFDALPFRDGTFASVSIVASLNYFDAPVAVLAECRRVLRPHGSVVLTLLNPTVGRLWHRIREPWAKHPGFSQDQLQGYAREAGLRVSSRRRFMLGLNNLYRLKREPRPIFLVSTGRTGTKYFSKLFGEQGVGIASYHAVGATRLVNVLANAQELGLLPRSWVARLWNRVTGRSVESHAARYAESNPYYYNLNEIIAERFPEAQFVFVVRSPRGFVTSHLAWERQRWQSALANRLIPFWQPVGYGAQLAGLRNDTHQRVEFYSRVWARRNAAILRTLAKVKHARTLRFEDAFDPETGHEVLASLMDWLGVELRRPLDSASVARRENTSEGEDFWDERCDEIVRIHCGRLMERFGYD